MNDDRMYDALNKTILDSEEKFNLIIKHYEAQLERNKETAKDIYLKAAEYDGKEDSPEKEQVMYELHQLINLKDGKKGSLLEEREKLIEKINSLKLLSDKIKESKKRVYDIDEALSKISNFSNPEFINFIKQMKEKKLEITNSLSSLYNEVLEDNKDINFDNLKKEYGQDVENEEEKEVEEPSIDSKKEEMPEEEVIKPKEVTKKSGKWVKRISAIALGVGTSALINFVAGPVGTGISQIVATVGLGVTNNLKNSINEQVEEKEDMFKEGVEVSSVSSVKTSFREKLKQFFSKKDTLDWISNYLATVLATGSVIGIASTIKSNNSNSIEQGLSGVPKTPTTQSLNGEDFAIGDHLSSEYNGVGYDKAIWANTKENAETINGSLVNENSYVKNAVIVDKDNNVLQYIDKKGITATEIENLAKKNNGYAAYNVTNQDGIPQMWQTKENLVDNVVSSVQKGGVR